MGLITKEVEVRWSGSNKRNLIDKGYSFTKIGDTVKIQVSHLTKGSNVEVLVECDYCGEKKEIKYSTYINNYYLNSTGRYACLKCFGRLKNTLSYDVVRRRVESLGDGYKLLSKNYKNNKEKIKIQCDKGHIYFTQANIVNQGCKCPICFKENHNWDGENNPNYNPNLSDEERIKNRDTLENVNWRKSVYERDNYTCQCCGQYSGSIEAHHQDGYDWCIEKRIDVTNGVTLCVECHKDFHSLYGYGNNTKQQFDEYIKQHQNLNNVNRNIIRKKYRKSSRIETSKEEVLEIKWMLTHTDLTYREILEVMGLKGVSISSIKTEKTFSYVVLNEDFKISDHTKDRINQVVSKRDTYIHPNRKISNENMFKIIQYIKKGISSRNIAKKFDISRSYVDKIKRNETKFKINIA